MAPEEPIQPEIQDEYPRLPRELKKPIPILITGKKIGSGSEGTVFEGTEEGSTEKKAIKRPNFLGALAMIFKFRHDIWERCKDAYEAEGVPHIDAEFNPKAIIADGRYGRRRMHKNVQTSPLIDDIGTKTLDYPMMMDPEIGQQVIIEVANILVQSHTMAKNKKIGLDSFGIEASMKVLQAVPPSVLLHIFNLLPEGLRDLARQTIFAEPIKINNLVHFKQGEETEPTLKLIDIGGLELDDPVYGQILTFLYELGMAGLTETVLLANRDLSAKEGRAPNREVLTKLATIKEEKRDARAYQIIAETMIKIITPHLRKSVEDKKRKHPADALKEAVTAFKTQVKALIPTPTR